MDEEPIAALNVIPFVDIMLVLLTVMLTTANRPAEEQDHRTCRRRRDL